jgi:hypothetical protein
MYRIGPGVDRYMTAPGGWLLPVSVSRRIKNVPYNIPRKLAALRRFVNGLPILRRFVKR